MSGGFYTDRTGSHSSVQVDQLMSGGFYTGRTGSHSSVQVDELKSGGFYTDRTGSHSSVQVDELIISNNSWTVEGIKSRTLCFYPGWKSMCHFGHQKSKHLSLRQNGSDQNSSKSHA